MSSVLERNLAALERTNPAAAARLREVGDEPDLAWVETKEPPAESAVLSLRDEAGGVRKITLASRFGPISEAERLASQADVAANGLIVVVGFGLGHHVRATMSRVAGKAAMLVYEPDAALFRAVLQRVDVCDLLAADGLLVFVGEPDSASMTAGIERLSAMLAQGVQFITHPPARQMHADRIRRFTEVFTDVVAYCRTMVATVMVNARATVRNLVGNLGWYAAAGTLNDLADAAKGKPAVVVAAGPSLAKNVSLLTEPGVRERVVIIAAQTVLKPLLAWGVRPHFVTALDYHEISARFYEDLPPLDDVTLVADPKANPVILNGFPGPIRLLQNDLLDALLGEHRRDMADLPSGATVAHLSFYLAQHLGCDPIVLTGQDLGFSDGLYYCPGTAIHDVWAGELGMFNTIEMMEWKRIARHKRQLQKRDDVHGRPIYTDEQMLTYLGRFERDFATAGQRIVDATEGGLPKQHTEPMTLREALDTWATTEVDDLPPPPTSLDEPRLRVVTEQFKRRRREVRELQRVTRRTLKLLHRMLRDQRDRRRMAGHFRQLERQQQRVAELDDAFTLVNQINQVAAYNRMRADRAIGIAASEGGIDEYERQRRQLERDVSNLKWLDESCEEAAALLENAAMPQVGFAREAGDGDGDVSEERLGETAAAQSSGTGGEA